MNNWMIWAVAGVGIFGAIILLRNQNQQTPPDTQATTPVGQSYSYLDGNGVQHLTATDPYGQLTNYATVPPQFVNQETGQMSSYVGMMGNVGYVQPYGFTTPYYSQAPQNSSGQTMSAWV